MTCKRKAKMFYSLPKGHLEVKADINSRHLLLKDLCQDVVWYLFDPETQVWISPFYLYLGGGQGANFNDIGIHIWNKDDIKQKIKCSKK